MSAIARPASGQGFHLGHCVPYQVAKIGKDSVLEISFSTPQVSRCLIPARLYLRVARFALFPWWLSSSRRFSQYRSILASVQSVRRVEPQNVGKTVS